VVCGRDIDELLISYRTFSLLHSSDPTLPAYPKHPKLDPAALAL